MSACSCQLPLWLYSPAPRHVQDRALLHASELWSGADKDGNGKLSLVELRQLLRDASRKYSHMEEHSRFLDGWACAVDRPLAVHSGFRVNTKP